MRRSGPINCLAEPRVQSNAERRKRNGLSVISTVTNKGQMRWKAVDGALNADILIDFLRRLVKDTGRKVYLVLDSLRVHHSKPVKAWLAQHKHGIEVFYLPSYRAELNPNESKATFNMRQFATQLKFNTSMPSQSLLRTPSTLPSACCAKRPRVAPCTGAASAQGQPPKAVRW